MDKHLIIIDLDGTLMLNFAEYEKNAVNLLKELTLEGHLILIATGRPFRSSYFVYKEIGLSTPIINYNGALVYNPNDSNFPPTDLRINRFDLFNILDFIGDNLINVFSEIHDDIFVLDYNKDIHPYLHVDNGVLHEGRLQEILKDNPNGSIIFVKEGFVETLQKYIEDNYSDTLRSRYWGENDLFHIVEVYNKNVNKGEGLKKAIEYYNINPKNVIAIGDGHNDIEMFNCSKICVAMANAHPELLPHANVITKSNKDLGVYLFLKEYFNK